MNLLLITVTYPNVSRAAFVRPQESHATDHLSPFRSNSAPLASVFPICWRKFSISTVVGIRGLRQVHTFDECCRVLSESCAADLAASNALHDPRLTGDQRIALHYELSEKALKLKALADEMAKNLILPTPPED